MGDTMEKQIEDVLNLSKREFIKLNLQWIEEENEGKLMDVHPTKCPLALWVAHNDAKCHRETVPLTDNCQLCGHPICPDCSNHVVDQISRVTGYLSAVSGWNAAKTQEFKDRQRYKT